MERDEKTVRDCRKKERKGEIKRQIDRKKEG